MINKRERRRVILRSGDEVMVGDDPRSHPAVELTRGGQRIKLLAIDLPMEIATITISPDGEAVLEYDEEWWEDGDRKAYDRLCESPGCGRPVFDEWGEAARSTCVGCRLEAGEEDSE